MAELKIKPWKLSSKGQAYHLFINLPPYKKLFDKQEMKKTHPGVEKGTDVTLSHT